MSRRRMAIETAFVCRHLRNDLWQMTQCRRRTSSIGIVYPGRVDSGFAKNPLLRQDNVGRAQNVHSPLDRTGVRRTAELKKSTRCLVGLFSGKYGLHCSSGFCRTAMQRLLYTQQPKKEQKYA